MESDLQNLVFSFCGAPRNTTSKNFTEVINSSFVPMKVMVGLYFYNGTNVTMCHVTVQHSANALGVLMYDMDGTVNVYHSNFVNNSNTTNTTGGGGFYVEFSYCVPGDKECGPFNRQHTHLTNSSYVFCHCTFTNNSATMTKTVRLIRHYNDHVGFGRWWGVGNLLH